MLHLLLIGLISILGQVVLLRELSVAFYGVDLIYTLALGIWLLWTAAGAAISRHNLDPSPLRVRLLFGLFSVLLPLDVACIRYMRALFSDVPGAYLPFQTQILALSISLLPIGLLLGLSFQWVAKIYLNEKKSLARAYAIESLGGLAGGSLATIFLKFGIQNFSIALICSLLSLAASSFHLKREGGFELRPSLTLLAGIFLLTLWKAPIIDPLMTSWSHTHLQESRDSPYSRVTVVKMGGQTAVFENDALSFTTEGTEAEEFVHLSALQHASPARVLILGGGIGGTVLEVLKHAPQQVDYVELNPFLLRLVQPHLPADLRESLRASNVRVLIADPRRFLVNAGTYDLILVGMPEPVSGQANRFYTAEFFEQCQRRLNPGGIVAFRLESSENLWTPQLTRRMVSIYRALKSALPEVIVLPGSTNIVLGSKEPLQRDPARLASRMASRGIKGKLVSPEYIQYLYRNDRFAQIAVVLETGSAPPNIDARPICYQYTVMIWLSKFFPSASSLDFWPLISWKRGTAWWIAALVLSVFFLLARSRNSCRRALLMGLAGFIGMALETLLILHYQVKSGVLFQDIGLLLMSFMAGLALGALTVDNRLRFLSSSEKTTRWWGTGMLAVFGLLSALTGLSIGSSKSVGLAGTAGLLALSGLLVAGIFAYASLQGVRDQKKVIVPLYAADLVGGCLGSLAASLFMIPAMGLATTAAIMVPLALLSALLI